MRISTLFSSSVSASLYIPNKNAKRSRPFPSSSPTLIFPFDDSHPNRCEVIVTVVLVFMIVLIRTEHSAGLCDTHLQISLLTYQPSHTKGPQPDPRNTWYVTQPGGFAGWLACVAQHHVGLTSKNFPQLDSKLRKLERDSLLAYKWKQQHSRAEKEMELQKTSKACKCWDPHKNYQNPSWCLD